MKQWPVILDPQASIDLDEIYVWVARHADEAVANRFTQRLLTFCDRLRMAPKRGVVRDDFRSGALLIGFERSVSVAFVVTEDEVRILRLLSRGRQFDSR